MGSPPRSNPWLKAWELVGEGPFNRHANEVSRPDPGNPWLLKSHRVLDFKGFARAMRETLDQSGVSARPSVDELDRLFDQTRGVPKPPTKDPITGRYKQLPQAVRHVEMSTFVESAHGWASARGHQPQDIAHILGHQRRRPHMPGTASPLGGSSPRQLSPRYGSFPLEPLHAVSRCISPRGSPTPPQQPFDEDLVKQLLT